jgi:hypothetical protein
LPAATTTTTPPNQSFSTARSSGSNMKLFADEEWSEKLATRMFLDSRFS